MFGECHAHIFMNGTDYKKAAAMYRNGIDREEIREDIRQKLKIYQEHEISFVRDGGDRYGASEYAREIAGEYGIDYRSPIFAIHKEGCYGGIVGKSFGSMSEFHQLVLTVRERRGDFIKIMLSGIMNFETDGSITSTALARNEIREMVHIAHEEGFAVMAHVNGAQAVLDAAEAGVDSVEHGNFLNQDALDAMAEYHTIWIPTFVTITNLLGDGRFSDEVILKLKEKGGYFIKKAMHMGIHIGLGSDAGAYRVEHGTGIEDEYKALSSLADDQETADRCFRETEQMIKERFLYR